MDGRLFIRNLRLVSMIRAVEKEFKNLLNEHRIFLSKKQIFIDSGSMKIIAQTNTIILWNPMLTLRLVHPWLSKP